jgi:hypothetical protein
MSDLLSHHVTKATAHTLRMLPLLPCMRPRIGPGVFNPHRHIHGRTYAPNGKRECERRGRQIAAGRLTASNGLVTC